MKRLIYLTLFFVAMASTETSAQSSLGDILGSIFSSSSDKSSKKSTESSAGDVLTSVFNNIIGTKTVTSKSLAGSWTYSEPAVAFSSQKLLNQAGGAVIANTVQKKLGNSLSKYGFTSGMSKITFVSDSTFTAKLKKKTIKGKYAVSGSTVTFYSGLGVKVATANAAIKGNALQLTFKADKLLKFAQYASTLTSNSTLSTVAGIAKNYDGMQLGMQFTK